MQSRHPHRRHVKPRGFPRVSRRIGFLLASVATLVVAPTAADAGTTALFHDCADGVLSKHYTAKQIGDALKSIPADVDEYSDCRVLLRRAQLLGAGGGGSASRGGFGPGGSSASGAGSSPASGTAPTGAADSSGDTPQADPRDPLASAKPEQRAAFERAVAAGAAPVALDGHPIAIAQPPSRTLPTSLRALLGLLLVGGLSAGALGVFRGARRSGT
jgi:hypothetical protein